MTKVIVIGGGPSGLTAAIHAAKNNSSVLLLEKNKICGKKLNMTGNGHCNYYNKDQNINHYHTSSNIDLSVLLNQYNFNKINKFFDKLGIIPKIKNGYFYPMSNQAISITNTLIKEANLNNVKIETEIIISNISEEGNRFVITTNNGNYTCDKLIVATGSKAYPKTGSDGIGYKLLSNLGHSITNITPSLVQLVTDDKITKEWDGVRCEALASLFANDEKQKEESGEIMLTDYGLSGICIFNLSGDAIENLSNNKVYIKLNFLHSLNIRNLDDALKFFNSYSSIVENRTISELLDNVVNYKLTNALLKKLKIDNNKKYNELSLSEQKKLCKLLTDYEVKIIGSKSFDNSQVCRGGLDLSEIDLNSMESKIIPNLYIVGELLDVDGDCGGYNLTWAFLSGMIAGESIHD